MNGKERILTALEVREPDRVPLYIHGINEESIISIGRHVTDGLPEPKQFHAMTEPERLKLLEALFLIHEEFGVDGFTSFEINQLRDLDATHAEDDWGVIYKRSPHGIPVVSGNPIPDAAALDRYTPPEPRREHLLLLDLARERFQGRKALFAAARDGHPGSAAGQHRGEAPAESGGRARHQSDLTGKIIRRIRQRKPFGHGRLPRWRRPPRDRAGDSSVTRARIRPASSHASCVPTRADDRKPVVLVARLG